MGSRDKGQTTSHHQPLLSSLVVRPSASDGVDGGGGGRGGGSDYEPGEVRRKPLPHSRSDRYNDEPGMQITIMVPILIAQVVVILVTGGVLLADIETRHLRLVEDRVVAIHTTAEILMGLDGPGPFRGEGMTRNNLNVCLGKETGYALILHVDT